MKKVLFGLTLVVSCLTFGQKVKIKDDIVLIDDKKCLKYDSEPLIRILKDFNNNDLIIIKYLNVNGKEYSKVIFINSKKELTSQNNIFVKKSLIEKLLNNNVLKDCIIQEDKIDSFILKYDEKVEKTN